jgi:two-component system CheB/CheR fusion protein
MKAKKPRSKSGGSSRSEASASPPPGKRRPACHDKKESPSKVPRIADAPAEEVEIGGTETGPTFPVVGVGASAGGLEALTHFLQALPDDTGMAFVFVQHLAPTHESALAEILSRATSMPVIEVVGEPGVQPNCIYVMPPGRNMVLARGHLRLLSREEQPHHPIDQFFRSLAETQRDRAIGVVLSGTASDGTLGLEEIKAEGGLTFAQDDSAQYDGMPLSAIASGCVDFVLPPEKIAVEITRIATHPLVTLRPGQGDGLAEMAPVLRLLRSSTDVDFAHYKANMVSRRITRRMVLSKKDGLKDYVKLLRESPAEMEALFQDILINVTSFFRDPETFEALKTDVIPALLKNRSRHEPVRVWVLGCSTGEEAYSLAMLLSEVLESANGHAAPQIFATDLNSVAVERARAGIYSKDRLRILTRERLRRFFFNEEVDGNFRVRKTIRDMCIFSRHNVMSDPPFSRMDLISCRNLLIYMDESLQQRILPILHGALNPNGVLLLGASETVGQFRDLFLTQDGKRKIFVKKPGSRRLPPLPPGRGAWLGRGRGEPAARFARGGTATGIGAEFGAPDLEKEADRLLLGLGPPAVLIDRNFEIIQFRGNTEPYLVQAQGRASLALLKMARPGLLIPLRALLQRAKRTNEPVREEGVRVRSTKGHHEISVQVLPVEAAEKGFLVLFESVPVEKPRVKAAKGSRKAVTQAGLRAAEAHSIRLEKELESTRDYLQSLSEQHEAAMEELQTANEEALSANEELQSINEELETSKEEIQSSNEELRTLNDELNSRNLELDQVNSDLRNLIQSVQVAIIIVGRDLRIRRLSPMAEKLLNIIPSDVGRPITDIRMKVDFPDLDLLLIEVIDSITPKEREVRAGDGRWYSLRLRPYLTPENKIDGAVMMLVDVDAIRSARVYAESIVATVREPLLVLSADLRVRSANHSFYATFDVMREATEDRLVYELGNGQWDIPELRRLLENVLSKASTVNDFIVEHEFERVGRKTMRLNARRLVIPGEEQESILLAIEDTSEISRLESVAMESAEKSKLFDWSPLPKWTLEIETLRFVDVNHAAIELYGYSREEFLMMRMQDLDTSGASEALPAAFTKLPHRLPNRQICQHRKKNGEIVDVEVRVNEIELAKKRLLLVSVNDITEHNRLERELRERALELDEANRGKANFIAVLSHELRTPLNAISGWAEILKRPEINEDERRKGVETIARNTRIQAQIIADILDLNRISTGKLSLDLRSLDLGTEIDAAIAAVHPAAKEKQLHIELEGDSIPVVIRADSARFQQVLGNLLSNAIKFTPDGGAIRIALRKKGARAEVSVSDTGQGIGAEILPHIFERFRQSESPTSRLKGGLGLGLAVSKQLVELHGGDLSAQSPGKGAGATFTISLPLVSGIIPTLAAKGGPDPSSRLLSGFMVLVVDDDPDAREPVRRLLEHHGAEVVTVKSADEALEAIQQQRPDVLVSDIGMPGRDGYDLIGAIRALPPGRGGKIPAIALTAFGTAEDRERALRAGYMTHLAKPVEAADLLAAIAGLIPVPPAQPDAGKVDP